MNHISEVINQKLRFIFNAEQSTQHVLPKEEFVYYVFVKNISGINIENFKIQIINENNVHFDKTTESFPITLKPNENKLYTFKAHCDLEGEYIVHFVGQGDETEILYDTLKIKCSFKNIHETLTHKLHIYDFTPYENNYTLEADNYSQQVTQIFKRQKLPYPHELSNSINNDKSFQMQNQMVLNEETGTLEKDWFEENIESQSFIDQYNAAKNSKEYHYQYISRENFTKDAIETFTGENLQDLVDDINRNSTYFEAKFLKSGTNELLNDLNQYAPNGFIYRMGLLNSELYHKLGVIPSYDYMGDYLFRWAPKSYDLPNLYPKKKGMRWNENIWAGKGWSVYRYITNEYKQTEEYEKELENKNIQEKTLLEVFEDKKIAEKYIERLLYTDNLIRAQQRSNVIKYKYIIEESYLDNGVFFVKIPLSKIPSNFIIPSTEELYAIINRAKPFGAKPLIKYSINEIFNDNIDFNVKLNYHTKELFDFGLMEQGHHIVSKKILTTTKECHGKEINWINETPVLETFDYPQSNLFEQNHDFSTNIFYKTKECFVQEEERDGSLIETSIEQQTSPGYVFTPDNDLLYLEDILETLYQKNNNNISFYLIGNNLEKNKIYDINKKYNFLEIPIKDGQARIKIIDGNDKAHIFECYIDKYYNLQHIKNSVVNNDKEYILQEGFEDITSLLLYENQILNKKIFVWFAKDKSNRIHYFNHEIADSIQEIIVYNNTSITDTELNKSIYLSEQNSIIFETPFFLKQKIITPNFVNKETNWNNLYRINNYENTYAYIDNITTQDIVPDDIKYLFNDINLPETALINDVHLRIKSSSKNKNIYLWNAKNTKYIDSTAQTHFLCLEPNYIEVYQYNKESPSFYAKKLEEYSEKNNKTLVNKYKNLLEKSILFNEAIDVAVEDYVKNGNIEEDNIQKANKFIKIKKDFWYEISEFTEAIYKLNETQSISFIIEGYNTEKETEIIVQTLSDINFANQVTTETIPSGYFRKKINLYYPNSFNTNSFKVRFRFKELNHLIKIFDTRINIEFKQAQDYDIAWEYVAEIESTKENNIILIQDSNNVYEINNGIGIQLLFENITQGEYYHLNVLQLLILYKETDMEMLINKNKYYYSSNDTRVSNITGSCTEKNQVYPSVEFYNDIVTMSQPNNNIGPSNNGIKLKKSLFQSFITRDDNITNIEIFPNGVLGNPDENIKIGLYENHEHSPGKLIKEVYVNGWLKNNEELKNLPSIKYNINVNNLKINTTYWFKLEVISPKNNTYYLLKSIDTPQNDCKLLINENNNYINTFSALQFNIYSKNLSKTFASIPCLQTTFDNPYIKIGLHKSEGNIRKLRVNKVTSSFLIGENYMLEQFDNNSEEEMIIKIKNNDNNDEIVI